MDTRRRESRTRKRSPMRRPSRSQPLSDVAVTRETDTPAETMWALRLFGDRDLRIAPMEAPPAPAPGEVQIRVRAVGLNHIDVWGFRGMAFAKRKLPLAVGAEASGEIAKLGEGVTGFKVGQRVVMYG